MTIVVAAVEMILTLRMPLVRSSRIFLKPKPQALKTQTPNPKSSKNRKTREPQTLNPRTPNPKPQKL